MLKHDRAEYQYVPTTKDSDFDDILFAKYKPSKNKLPHTSWYKEMVYSYTTGVASAFILYNNVNDLAIPSYSVVEYLKDKIATEFKISDICVFDLVSTNEKMHYANIELANFEYRMDNIINILKFNYKKSDRRKVAIVKYPEFIIPNKSNLGDLDNRNIVRLLSLVDNEDFKESGNILIILAETKDSIHPKLLSSTSGFEAIEIPRPNESQREKMLHYLQQNCQKLKLNGIKGFKELAKITSGLTLSNIEQLWKRSTLDEILDVEAVREYKAKIYKKEYSDILEICEPNPKYTLDNYGGMDKVKEFLREGIINPMQTGDKQMIPKGLLFMGASGTGKTYLAKCLASESGTSFVEIKLSKFISKWVGESEQNLAKIFQCVKSLAPCFLFVDEIDQVLQRGDEDCNGVRGTIFQMFMNFLSDPDNRGDIVFIASTNYPNKLDEALKRAGRFDIKLVFTPPVNKDEIDSVLTTHLNFVEHPVAVEKGTSGYKELIDKLDSFSQAEIEAVVLKALNLAKRRQEPAINIHLLQEALEYIKRSDNKELRNMIKLAIEECNDYEFLSKEVLDKYYNSDTYNEFW